MTETNESNNFHRFIIITQGRTGGTTLQKILNIHPKINTIFEPFSPRKNIGISFSRKYLNENHEIASLVPKPLVPETEYYHWVHQYPISVLKKVLEEIHQEFNGIKHLLYSLPYEMNQYLLRQPEYKLIVLTRQNLLQQAISFNISNQSGEWETNQKKVIESQYVPINVQTLKDTIAQYQQEIKVYKVELQKMNRDFLEIHYEDIFNIDLSLEVKLEKVYQILNYLGFSWFEEEEQVNRVKDLLDPKKTKLNSHQTYLLIPNILEIEKELGCEETGYLFGQEANKYFSLGKMLQQEGKLEQAIVSFRQAIELNPEEPAFYGHLGNVLADNNQIEAAIACHQKVSQLIGWEQYTLKGYEFTQDWFTNHISNWNKYLKQFAGKPINVLEIGSYQGRSTCWLLDHILTHDSATITCVDPYWPSYVHYFDANIIKTNAASKVIKRQGTSEEVLSSLQADTYDFIYIDGNHDDAVVLYDAIYSWNLVKVDGLIIFDDYLCPIPKENTKLGTDLFLSQYKSTLEVIHKEYQVIVKKVSNNLNQDLSVRSQFFKKGNQLYRQGNIAEAVVAYQVYTKLNPNFYCSWHNLGEVLVKQSYLDQAVSAYRQAIALNPNSVWSYYNLGEVLAKQGDTEGAISAYRHASELKPDVMYFQQPLREAITAHRYAIEINPDIPPKTTYYNAPTLNDRWIVEYVFPGKRKGYFFEAGAANGQNASSCFVLEKELGWTGICVEPNSDFFQELLRNRPNSICENICLANHSGRVAYIEGGSNMVNPYLGGIKENLEQFKHNGSTVINEGQEVQKLALTMEAVLKKHQAPKIIDYAAFDIEGSELPVLEVFPFDEYLILALSIETGGVAWSKIYELLASKGYIEVQKC